MSKIVAEMNEPAWFGRKTALGSFRGQSCADTGPVIIREVGTIKENVSALPWKYRNIEKVLKGNCPPS